MLFSLEALQVAVGQHISLALAERVGAVALASAATGPVDEDRAGELIAEALTGAECGSLGIVGVDLQTTGNGPAALSPGDAVAHPAIGYWVPSSLDFAIGAAIRAGTQLTQLSIGAPHFEAVEIIEVEGKQCGGALRLNFGALEFTAVCLYGDPAFCRSSPAATLRRLSGDALVTLGVTLRSAAQPVVAVSPEAQAETRH